jgi:hypothetical protein
MKKSGSKYFKNILKKAKVKGAIDINYNKYVVSHPKRQAEIRYSLKINSQKSLVFRKSTIQELCGL